MTDQEPQPRAETETNLLSPVVKKREKMTRRDFLKLSLLGVAHLTGLRNLADYFGLLGQLEKTAFTANLPDEVPQSLQNVEVPKRNEQLRKPQQIVQEAFDIYNGWGKQDQSLPKLHWNQPDNFLEYGDIISAIDQPTSTPGYESLEGLAWKLEDSVYKNDKPYSKFSYFGAADVHGAIDLIRIDPGSGMAKKVVERFKSLKNEQNYDLYSAIENKRFSDQDKAILVQQVKSLVEGATSFIEDRGKMKPVSTSILLAYFLHQNEGNIPQSFWDTTVVLKLICRNNLDTFEYEPTRNGADRLSSLFLDEFSPKISLNWLCENVPPSDQTLNVSGSLEGEMYKNYQPINRAGGLYHAWNIISWTACMSPDLVMNLTRSFFLHGLLGGYDIRPSNGSEKVKADLRVASYAADIHNVLMPHYKS